MAKATKAERKRAPVAADDTVEKGSPALDKIAGLLVLIATREMENEVAALKLDAIGFTSHEIAALLDVNENFVRVARHRRNRRR
ncbi:MAG: hypothetical protein BroJett024_44830 [Alphaproteobacteria bacterium]|nr:MAG: hypothetical protein BroJett024_44830 [Alphaproteobacteria bacterium]